MSQPYNVVDVRQRTEAWLRWREEGVAASEAAVIMNQDPHKTYWRLWAEKVGLAIPEDLSKNPFVQWGIANEDLARQDFEARHPGEFAIPMCVESVKYPWMKASLDGLISGNRPVELKCPADSTFDEVCRNGTSSPTYKLYWHQVQHQLAVTGANEGFLVFWKLGQEPQIFRIERDDAFIFDLIKECEKFAESVLKRKSPPKDPERDVFIPTGRLAAAWLSATQELRELDANLAPLEEEVEKLQVLRKKTVSELKCLMGEFYNAEYDGVKLTRFKRAGKVDYKKLLRDKLPDLTKAEIDEYRSEGSEQVLPTVTDRESGLPRNIVDPAALDELRSLQQKPRSAPVFF